MSTMDREVALEALSALFEKNMKPCSAGKENPNVLNIHNFLTVFLQQLAGRFYQQQAPVAGFNSDVRNEMFVDMDELFEPRYDYDFTHLSDKSKYERGNEEYRRPCGWYRIALKVQNKYPDGNTWLGTDGLRSHSVAGEWPVSYHGTSVDSAKAIIKNHYKAGPGKLYGRGIYSTPDIEQASGYCKEFTSKKTGKRYRVMMQNRINPKMRKECRRTDYWLIEIPEGTSDDKEEEIVEKAIRPYGILLKEV